VGRAKSRPERGDGGALGCWLGMANLGRGPETAARERRAASRSCGSCSLCCTVLRVDELGKRAGEDCPHQRGEKGCGVYETRPPICRNYHCLWRQGGLEDDERPDATGGVVDLETVGIGLRLGIRLQKLEQFERSPKLLAIAERYRSEMPVRISDAEDVMNPDRPFEVLLPEGVSHRVEGARIDVYHDGVLIEERVLPWAERWARQALIWWRNLRLH
jgi:Fe-S-cluster containining protein